MPTTLPLTREALTTEKRKKKSSKEMLQSMEYAVCMRGNAVLLFLFRKEREEKALTMELVVVKIQNIESLLYLIV